MSNDNKQSNLQVGDLVGRWGLDLTPLTIWERLICQPRWWFNDVSYWFRKRGQSLRDGFPSEESFDFYSFCAKWSLPRLKQLRNNLNGFPSEFSQLDQYEDFTGQQEFDFVKDFPRDSGLKKWKDILDKIIWSMEHHDDPVEPIYPPNYDSRQIVVSVNDSGTSFSNADERPLDWSPVVNHEERVSEGFLLFGKYFRSLWD